MPDQEQRVFNARYELHRRIARGGMADVFLARDSLLDRPVAVKVLFPEFATDPTFVQRFRREAQAAANLSHPNIVSVYDWGEEGGTYFIVMEYVEGRSLAQLIRDEGRIEPERAADIAADVAAALGFAHRNGVVHRDVKPGNVIISPSGQVKVADFGIARAVSNQENLTQAGTVMGTATYFSPEQARGEAVDPRSDVYSLGVVLYEMLTGRPPFTGDSPVAVAYKHVQEIPQPPRARNPRIPGALEAIVLQAMAKETAERYASAEDLRSDLRRFRQGSPVSAETAAVAAAAVDQTRAVAPPVVDPGATRAIPSPVAAAGATQVLHRQEERYVDEPPRRTNPAFIVVLVVMLALLAGLLYLLVRNLGSDAGGEVAVPNVVAQTEERASQILEDAGLEVTARPMENPDVPEGEVFAQDPAAGTVVQEGDLVTITVSSGEAPVAVPRVVDLRELEADGRLDAAGLVGDFRPQESDDVAAGIVISQQPEEGEMVAPGSTVVVQVSSGPATATVPPVVNLTQADATNILSRAGFRTEVRQQNANAPAGTVVATEPGPGAQAPEGSTVVIVVSNGPATTTTTEATTTTTEATTTTTMRSTTTFTFRDRTTTTTTTEEEE